MSNFKLTLATATAATLAVVASAAPVVGWIHFF